MNLPKVAVVFNWRNENNKSGLYSIHLRITIERQSKYFKIHLPEKVSQSQWAGKEDGWVKPNHPFAFEINNKIAEKKELVRELIKRHYNQNKVLNFPGIFRQLRRKGDSNSFLDYMIAYISNPPEKLEENTLKKYNTCLQHLTKFKSAIYFSDVDPNFVNDFNKYLQVDLKLGGPTVKKYFDALKKVIKAARRENYIDPSQMEFLFDDVKMSAKRTTKRIYLEIDEVKKWKAVEFPQNKKYLERDRDLFLFQIYTGFYYKDIQIFKKEQLVDDEEFGYFIIGERDKNGNDTIVPLFKFPHASPLIHKYQSSPDQKTVFEPNIFIEEPVYNRNLKEIARLAKINKNVSNKVARHTNAQLWVRYGAERPILSKMMGHAKEETTKNYFSVNIPEIVEGTRRINFKKLGI